MFKSMRSLVNERVPASKRLVVLATQVIIELFKEPETREEAWRLVKTWRRAEINVTGLREGSTSTTTGALLLNRATERGSISGG